MDEIMQHVQEVPQGQVMQPNYTTAMQILTPRKLAEVERRVLEEAAIAGEEFYYQWPVKDRKKGTTKIVEGLSVGAALCIARNWGNCGVRALYQETKEAFHFDGQFVDLETGFNLSRPFRQNKSSMMGSDGKKIYDEGRQQDIQFQIGASKALRNVVMNAAPKWLTTKVLGKAKEHVGEKIEKLGIEKARDMMTSKAAALGVDMKRVEHNYGKRGAWSKERLVAMSGCFRALENGEEAMEKLFPLPEDNVSERTATKSEALKERLEKTSQANEKEEKEKPPKKEPAKRGRPAGSKNKPKEEPEPEKQEPTDEEPPLTPEDVVNHAMKIHSLDDQEKALFIVNDIVTTHYRGRDLEELSANQLSTVMMLVEEQAKAK